MGVEPAKPMTLSITLTPADRPPKTTAPSLPRQLAPNPRCPLSTSANHSRAPPLPVPSAPPSKPPPSLVPRPPQKRTAAPPPLNLHQLNRRPPRASAPIRTIAQLETRLCHFMTFQVHCPRDVALRCFEIAPTGRRLSAPNLIRNFPRPLERTGSRRGDRRAPTLASTGVEIAIPGSFKPPAVTATPAHPTNARNST